MKVNLFVFLLLLLPLENFAKEAMPSEIHQHNYSIGLREFEDEREFNRAGTDIDEIKLIGTEGSLIYKYKFNKNILLGAEVLYLIDGRFREEYKEELDYIEDRKVFANGFQEPAFIIDYWKKSHTKDFYHGLNFFYRPKIATPSIENYGNGRHELKVTYFYKYSKNRFTLDGEVYSYMYGRKKVKLSPGTVERTGGYTEITVGAMVGYRFAKVHPKFRFAYSSTTDFNTKNKYFERKSDKGFGIIAEFQLDYYTADSKWINLTVHSDTKKFNSIEEDVSRDISYELESRYIKLSYNFGLN